MSNIKNRVFIIEENTVLTFQPIKDYKLTEIFLLEKKNNGITYFLAKFRLINNFQICENCEIKMNFYEDQKLADKGRFVCSLCKKKCSLRNKSFFFGRESNLKRSYLF